MQDFENQGRSYVLNIIPIMVTRFVSRKMHLLQARIVLLGLNGLDLEQMSDDRDGRLPLELVDIWNESFVYFVV